VVCWRWENNPRRGGDFRRFYTKQHQFYCGIDLHARTMYVCVLNRDGEVLLHRHMKAAAAALFLRQDLESGKKRKSARRISSFLDTWEPHTGSAVQRFAKH
jgi:hypothetical protein